MNQRICIFDIDGVLNYYPDCWVEYIRERTGFAISDLDEAKQQLSHAEYKALKSDYRSSGYKADLLPRVGARELLRLLRRNGFYVIILTSRPVNEHNSLIMQTTNWLHRYWFEYDYLLFEREKHLEIIQKFGNVEFVVEDNRSYANNIAKYSGVKVFLVNNAYNQGATEQGVCRVQSLEEIAKIKNIGWC